MVKCPGCGASYKKITRNRIDKIHISRKNVRRRKEVKCDTRGVKAPAPISPEKYERNLGIGFIVWSLILLQWSILYMI